MKDIEIKKVSCGILYDYSFSLLDCWGEIADSILYNNKYFNVEYFPNINHQYTTERALYNKKTENQLRISANNLIFTHNIESDFNDEFQFFMKRTAEFLVPQIIEKKKLAVNRIGIVFECKIEEEKYRCFKQKYFKDEMDGIYDFRFAKRETTTIGEMWKNRSDYVNKIYTVGAPADGKYMFSYDYQRFFIPGHKYISDDINKILLTGKKELIDELKTGVIGINSNEK